MATIEEIARRLFDAFHERYTRPREWDSHPDHDTGSGEVGRNVFRDMARAACALLSGKNDEPQPEIVNPRPVTQTEASRVGQPAAKHDNTAAQEKLDPDAQTVSPYNAAKNMAAQEKPSGKADEQAQKRPAKGR